MGKKRKIISKPQKFARKFANHPSTVKNNAKEKKVELEPKVEKFEVEKEDVTPPPAVDAKKQPKKPKVKSTPAIKKTKPVSDKVI